MISVTDIADRHPCHRYCLPNGYTPDVDRIREGLGGKDAVEVLEICDLDIPWADRLWLLTQPGFTTVSERVCLAAIREEFEAVGRLDVFEDWFLHRGRAKLEGLSDLMQEMSWELGFFCRKANQYVAPTLSGAWGIFCTIQKRRNGLALISSKSGAEHFVELYRKELQNGQE